VKWLGGIITSLVVLALGTIFVAFLQPLVRAIAPEDQLLAEVELSRWQALPEKAETVTQNESDDEFLAQANKDSFLISDFYDFAAITIDNPTAKVAENVRVKIADRSRLDALILSDDGLTRTTLKGKHDFKLPDMRPGDRVKMFLWGDSQFPKTLVTDQIKTFSSLGAMRTKFSAPSDNMYFESQDSALFKFIDDWIGVAFLVIFGSLIIVMFIALVFYENYFKNLLKDEKFYQLEKERYNDEPKKFSPKMPD